MRKPTDNLGAYDYYLRGMSSFHKAGRDDINEALRLFLDRAVTLFDRAQALTVC